MWQPKRVWSNKKTVWDWKKSVWLQDWELKTFDGHWKDAWDDLQVYATEWQDVSENAELDVYDSITPEPIGTPEDWLEATYTFKDYDGTVLKTWKVKDWETPTAPTNPTREATAQYTYTFAWWSPSVWPIYKNTEYIATYTTTVNTYTVTIASNDTDYWTVDESSLTVEYGTAISASDNVLTIGETEVTATAESGYEFTSWWTLPATVTENLSITATFSAVTPPASWFNIEITSSTWDIADNESGEAQELPIVVWFGEGDEVTVMADVVSLVLTWNDWSDSLVYMALEPEEWVTFSHWEMDWVTMVDQVEVTVTSATTITAVFVTQE